MSRLQAINLAISFGLGLLLYGFIFANYHYKFTTPYFFIALFWIGLIIFFILMAWFDD